MKNLDSYSYLLDRRFSEEYVFHVDKELSNTTWVNGEPKTLMKLAKC